MIFSYLVVIRFYHAYDNYMTYAFPVSVNYFQLIICKSFMNSEFLYLQQHDELKPITKTFTDSLSELGNLKVPY